MLLQACSFIVFLHPNAAMQRQLSDFEPECQTAVVQEEAGRYFCSATELFIRGKVSQMFQAFDT